MAAWLQVQIVWLTCSASWTEAVQFEVWTYDRQLSLNGGNTNTILMQAPVILCHRCTVVTADARRH